VENAESVAFIRQFIDACVRADPDEFASYFTEDAIGGIRLGKLSRDVTPFGIPYDAAPSA